MPNLEPDLPALVAARICHDLISPMGAIGNGLELLEMSGATAGPELALVRASVQQAQSRIRLFRIAFGKVGHDQTIGAEELRGILREYAEHARFDLDWIPLPNQPKPMVKLGLLVLLCVETLLPYGGLARCDLSEAGVRMSAQSDRPVRETGLWDALASHGPWPADLRAARVQFPLLAQTSSALGHALNVAFTERGVDVQVTAD